MIVLMVISILAVLGYPVYRSQMTENRRSDGQRVLLEIMNEQQKFFSRNGQYTLDLVDADPTVGLGLPDPNGDGTVPSENEFYLVTAQLCAASTINECVQLTAAPQPGQTSDGPLTYNSRNQKTPIAKW